MEEGERKSIGRELNAWVQTVGILIAAAWGIYTFVYTQMIAPKSAPVNVTVDLGLKKVSAGRTGQKNPARDLVPVEMRVSARNPSSREIYLKPSVWMAVGVKVTSANVPLDNEQPIGTANGNAFDQRYASTSESTVIAFGGLLEDTSLKPNEVSGRTFIFFVPPNLYDYIDVVTVMPTTDRRGVIDMEWKLNASTAMMEPTYYRLDSKGQRQGELKQDEIYRYSAARKLELQSAISRAQLSLWE
jgi:hypothetical protein